MQKLVNRLLIMGDEQLQLLRDQPIISPVTGKLLSSYRNLTSNSILQEGEIVTHRRMVDSVLLAIKPGLCAIYCSSFTKQMIYDYLKEIKYKNIEAQAKLDAAAVKLAAKETKKSIFNSTKIEPIEQVVQKDNGK